MRAGMLTGMINLRGIGAHSVVAIAAGALLLAGCGSNEESSGGVSTAAPSTPRDQLLLTPEEFPPNSKKVDLPKDRLEGATADLAGIQQSATLSPEECAGTQQDLSTATKDLLGQSAVAGATDEKSGVMYVEFVSGRAGNLAQITDGNRKCGEVTVTSSIEGRQITTVSKVENLTAPAELKSVDAIVYRSTTISTVGSGKPLTSTSYMGMATLRGATVAVRVSALRDAVDEPTFRQLFIAAVRKVEKAD
ncbi:hypothetical protein [Nocardia sp. NPDC050710]|uniref:hypothetical protein n=1 Tax=Nocardia sp. NPDC050710 TaxID=3157220 RepID=UPI0033CC13A4